MNMLNLSERIISYELGEGDANDTLNLFADLVRTGMVWGLQGHYGRTAQYLMDKGYLDISGNILKDAQ